MSNSAYTNNKKKTEEFGTAIVSGIIYQDYICLNANYNCIEEKFDFIAIEKLSK